MAIQTRYVGDSLGVVNVDGNVTAAGSIVATGLTKAPIALKILLGNSQNFGDAEMVTLGAVETVLRNIALDSTITMYQVERTGGQMSVLLEASGAGTSTAATAGSGYTASTVATAIQTRLQAIGGNIGVAANVWMGGGVAVTSGGFKLA
jgi:hypothetical protein